MHVIDMPSCRERRCFSASVCLYLLFNTHCKSRRSNMIALFISCKYLMRSYMCNPLCCRVFNEVALWFSVL